MMQAEDLHVQFGGRRLEESIRDAASIYQEHGCFLAKGLFTDSDLEPVRAEVSALIGVLFDQLKRPRPQGNGSRRFDDGLMELAGIDRKLVSRIYEAGPRLLPINRLALDTRLSDLALGLIGGGGLLSAEDVRVMRIDMPNEGKYLFNWHQDYPYIMDSKDAVVFWFPIHDVDETNGSLSVAPGSHRHDVMPVVVVDPDNLANNKQRVMHIANLKLLETTEQIRVPVKAGDVLAFSALLLHASNPNRSDRARFTIQTRFGNFMHPVAIEKGWPGSTRNGYKFHEVHPEYIVQAEPAMTGDSR